MDRTKYGRRLTFLNAYFSAAIGIITYSIAILAFLWNATFSPIWLLLFGMRTLVNNVWDDCRQTIELRAGLPVEDTRTTYPTDSHKAFREARFNGLGMLGLAALFFYIFRQEPNPVSNYKNGQLIVEVLLSLGVVWGMLWLDRASWEWRALRGKVHPTEWVERVSEDTIVLPDTESGMKRYIRESTWLCRFGAWFIGGTLLLPGILRCGTSWSEAALATAISGGILLLLVPSWSQIRKNRDACQQKLKETQAVAVPLRVSTVETPVPVYQHLKP